MNLFGTVLTYTAPTANYRGESAENRSVIQKITLERHEYAIISPEALRNALRETLRALALPCNRERLPDEAQLAVKFQDYPDHEKYADDFFMGWMIAAGTNERQQILAQLEQNSRDSSKFSFKRDSILHMNMAVALQPYRHDSVFTQSPLNVDSPWQNADSSQLLHRETAFTAFQYPFALNIEECRVKADWTKTLLRAIGQLNNVAGNHARSYFEMAPASVVVRLTAQLVAGYDTYGFRIEQNRLTNGDGRHLLPEVVDGILEGDYPGAEFFLGGKLIKDMDEDALAGLRNEGATLCRSSQKLLEIVVEKAFTNETKGGL